MIEFFVIENDQKVDPLFFTTNSDDRGIPYESCVESLWRQSKELGVKTSIKQVPIWDVPTKTDCLLVGILSYNNLIPSDYLVRVLACNNLYRSANGFIGDHTPLLKHLDPIDVLYHQRRGESSEDVLMRYSTECTPLIYGAIFSGYYYNSVGGFVAKKTPKSYSLLNKMVNKNLIWSKRLGIMEYVPEYQDLTDWFYHLGYFYQNKNYLPIINSKIEYCYAYDMGYYEAKLGEKNVNTSAN